MALRAFISCVALLALTTTSDADLGNACRAVCGRVQACKIMSARSCMKMCMTSGTKEPLAYEQSRMSCPMLTKQLAPAKWTCIAEGASSYGLGAGGNTPDYSGTKEIWQLGTGRTRADAERKAMNECNSLMTLNLDLERGMSDNPQWDAEITSQCHIADCIVPRQP